MESTCKSCGKGSEYGPLHQLDGDIVHMACYMTVEQEHVVDNRFDIDMVDYPRYEIRTDFNNIVNGGELAFTIVPEDSPEDSNTVTIERLVEKYNDLVDAINDYNYDMSMKDGDS